MSVEKFTRDGAEKLGIVGSVKKSLNPPRREKSAKYLAGGAVCSQLPTCSLKDQKKIRFPLSEWYIECEHPSPHHCEFLDLYANTESFRSRSRPDSSFFSWSRTLTVRSAPASPFCLKKRILFKSLLQLPVSRHIFKFPISYFIHTVLTQVFGAKD